MAVIRFHGKQSVIKIDTAAVGGVQDVSASFDDGTLQADVQNDPTQAFGDQAERFGTLGLEDNKLSLSGWLRDHPSGLKIHGKNTRLYMDQYSIYQWLNTAKLGRTIGYDPTQAFGDLAKRYQLAGLLKTALSSSGQIDYSANAIEQIMRTAKSIDPSAGSAFPIWTITSNGTAVGAYAEMLQAKPNKWGIKTGEGKVQMLDLGFVVDDVSDLGCILHGEVSEVGTMNGSSVDETAATTSLGAVAHIHTIAVTGNPAATVKFQHSVDNSVWVDLLTSAAITAVGKQRLTVAPGVTINRYKRIIISAHAAGGTALTFIAAFATRGFTYGLAGSHRHWAGIMGANLYGTLTSSTPLGATAFEFGPYGTTAGNTKYSGNLRLSDYSIDFGEEKPTRISLSMPIDGQVTPGTY